MKHFLRFRRSILAVMLGLGVATALSACTVDTDWRHDSADHSDLYR